MTKTITIDPKLVDQLLETYQQPEDLLGEWGCQGFVETRFVFAQDRSKTAGER